MVGKARQLCVPKQLADEARGGPINPLFRNPPHLPLWAAGVIERHAVAHLSTAARAARICRPGALDRLLR